MMRRAILAAAIVTAMTALPVPAAAQTPSAPELLERYEQNRIAFLELVAGLSPAQWTFKEAPERWSIAEVAEHVALTDRWVLGVLTEGLREIDPSDEARTRAAALEGQITSALRDRSQKFEAPDPVRPAGALVEGPEIVEKFAETRAALEGYLQSVDYDMRTRVATNPNLGADMDARVWAVLVLEHTARHIEQMREVMAADGFPGS